MKRVIFGLLMLGSFALAAAPAHANFNLNLACGNSYAVEIHGTEPSLTDDSVLHYIAGIGQITLGAKSSSAIGAGCMVTGGEMIYNDNDVLTYSAGPATCYTGSSLLGGGIPCFNGAAGGVTGSLVSGPDGGKTLSIVLNENWLNGSPGVSTLPLSFTIQGSGGDIWMMGNSVPDVAGPTTLPPGGAALTITMQKQSTSITLPVTGPGNQTGSLIFPQFSPPAPLGLTGGGGNGFGVAPYLGLSVSLFQGFGAPSADLFSQPITGSFGSTISSLQIFPNGQAGGSASFSTNDNVGNTAAPATNDDCDTIVTQTGNFADGTSNDAAAFPHPSTTCSDGAQNATFELSSVLWGTIDQNMFSIVTGLSALSLTSGGIIPAGLMSDANGLSSAPAGVVVNLVFTSITSVNGHTATFPFVEFFSDTPAGCDVSINMPTVTANGCTIQLDNLSNVATNPVTAVVPGDAFPFSKYAFESCTCAGSSGSSSATTTLTITSPDCPLSGNTIYDGGSPTPPHGPVITCKN